MTTGAHLYGSDDGRYFLHTENLALDQSLKLDPYSPNADAVFDIEKLQKLQRNNYSHQERDWNENTELVPFYTYSPLLVSFILTPFYLITTTYQLDPITTLTFFFNPIVLSLTSLVIFLVSDKYFQSKKIAFVLSLVFLVTTWIWSYNTGLMTRPLASLLLILSFYFIIKSTKDNFVFPIIAGVCLGLSQLASYSTIIFFPGILFFAIAKFPSRKRQTLFLLLSFGGILLIQGILNDLRFDSYFNFGTTLQGIDVHTHLDGLVGLIFSVGWGVFFNAPLLILFPPAMYFLLKEDKPLAILLIYSFVVAWLYFGTLQIPWWHGYGGWGPRLHGTILPLLIFSLGFMIKKFYYSKLFKVSFVALGIIGFFVSFLGKLVWFHYGYNYGWSVLKTHIIDDSFKLQNYDISFSPVALHIYALSTNFIQNLDPVGVKGWGHAPCPYDFFIYCEFGIFPSIIIVLALIMVSIVILKSITQNVIKHEN